MTKSRYQPNIFREALGIIDRQGPMDINEGERSPLSAALMLINTPLLPRFPQSDLTIEECLENVARFFEGTGEGESYEK